MFFLFKKGHENIINLFDCFMSEFKGKEALCLVTDRFKMNLDQYLSISLGKLDEPVCKKISVQILHALNFCHLNFITHEDLKLENVIINPNNLKIKLIDFGFSIISQNESEIKSLQEARGTPHYVAPVRKKKFYKQSFYKKK